MPVLLGWTVKNTDTLKIHPVEFRVLSEELLRFLGSQFEFWCNQSVFPGGSDLWLSELGPEIMIFADFWIKIRMSSELATWTVKYDSGETENYSRKPSENYGEHPDESTGVFDRPAE